MKSGDKQAVHNRRALPSAAIDDIYGYTDVVGRASKFT